MKDLINKEKNEIKKNPSQTFLTDLMQHRMKQGKIHRTKPMWIRIVKIKRKKQILDPDEY